MTFIYGKMVVNIIHRKKLSVCFSIYPTWLAKGDKLAFVCFYIKSHERISQKYCTVYPLLSCTFQFRIYMKQGRVERS